MRIVLLTLAWFSSTFASEDTELTYLAKKYPYVHQLMGTAFSQMAYQNLSGSLINHEGARGISLAIKENQSLTELSLRFCNLDDYISPPILETFFTNSSLKSLDLGYNNFGPQSFLLINQIIQNNITIISLDLTLTNYSGSKTIALFDALFKNPSLKEFFFDLNIFEKEAAHKLSLLQAPNRTLERLSLDFCVVSSEAFQELVQGAHQLKALKFLNLRNNHLSDSDSQTLAQLIMTCLTLEEIDITNNFFTLAGMLELKDILLTSPSHFFKKPRNKDLKIYVVSTKNHRTWLRFKIGKRFISIL
jgi:Ran GTPase-activating protein (RanGAP) involved in mRNA processing and transport